MIGRQKLAVLMVVAFGVSACEGSASSSAPAASSGAAPSTGAAASAAPSSSTAAVASQAALPGATTRCKPETADFTKTTVGPNGETSTSAADIPELTADQIAKAKAAKYKWAYLPSGTSTWFNAVEAGAKDEAAKLGLELTVTADSNLDPAKQASDVETAMKSKPDIMLSLPNDPTSAAQAFKPAVDAGSEACV